MKNASKRKRETRQEPSAAPLLEKSLRNILPGCLSLVEYVSLVTKDHCKLVREEERGSSFADFCQQVAILPDSSTQQPDFSKEAEHLNSAMMSTHSAAAAAAAGSGCGAQIEKEVSIKTCINRVIAHSVKVSGKSSGAGWYLKKNTLALGYRGKSDNWSGKAASDVKEFPTIQANCVNTVHSLLTSAETPWQKVANRLGESLFMHILMLPVVVPSSTVEGGGNRSYFQVSGVPVGEFLHLRQASDMAPRTFTEKRRETMHQLLENPLKPIPIELLDNLQVRGRTRLPRYGIFFKYFGEKGEVLSSVHPLHKMRSTDEYLTNRAFGLVKSIGRVKGFTTMNDPTPLGKEVRGMLVQLMGTVLDNYRKIDVVKVLKFHCPSGREINQSTGPCGLAAMKPELAEFEEELAKPEPELEQESALHQIPAKKRKLRGCRGGGQRKSRLIAPLPPAVSTLHPTGVTNIEPRSLRALSKQTVPKTNRKNPRRLGKGRGRCKRRNALITVGDRILSRYLARAQTEATFKEDGFFSQDDNDVPPHLPVPEFMSSELGGGQNTDYSFGELGARSSQSDLSVSQQTISLAGSIAQNESMLLCDQPKKTTFDIRADRKRRRCEHPESASDDAATLSSATTLTHTHTFSNTISSSDFLAPEDGLVAHILRPLMTEVSESGSLKSAKSLATASRVFILEAATAGVGVQRGGVAASGDGGKQNREYGPTGTASGGGAGVNGAGKASGVAANTSTSPIDYLALSVPINQVSEFVCSVCRHTLPVKFWGSRHNRDAFLSSMNRYVRLGQFETLNIEQLSHVIRVGEIPWLKSIALAVQQVMDSTTECESDEDAGASNDREDPRNRYPRSVPETNTLLLHAFLYWFVSDVVNPLLSCCFYCTEAEGKGSGAAAEVLYYHKSTWSFIMHRGAMQMSKQFMVVATPEVRADSTVAARKIAKRRKEMQSRLLPTIRFMPKASSLRPITKLRGKTFTGTSEGHIVHNKALLGALSVLTRICHSSPLHVGFGLHSMSHLYAKIRKFRAKLDDSVATAAEGHFPKIYMAVCDLEKCYDNVKTSMLYDLVKDLLDTEPGADENDGGFVVHKYTVTHYQASMEKPFTKKIKLVRSFGERHKFSEAVACISQNFRSSIIADQVMYDAMSKADVLKLVHTHLFNHVVTLPLHEKNGMAKQFTQVMGIPQGSVLSPLLCNLYYGHAERQIFGSDDGKEVQLLGLRDKSLIVRWMDDYIMLSTDQQCVQHFLQRAHQSLKPFGGGINPSKTRVNFDCTVEIEGRKVPLQRIVEGQSMTWCGLLVDPSTLEVRINFWKKLLEFPLHTTGSKVDGGHSLRCAIKTYVRMKASAVVLDTTLNSRATVMRTIYQMFLVAAMRTHCLIRKIRADRPRIAVRHNADYIVRCIDEAVLFGARLIHSRTSKKQTRVMRFEGDEEEDNDDSGDVSAFEQCIIDSTISADTIGSCTVDHGTSMWLGLSAFAAALSRKLGVYPTVLHSIRLKLARLELTLTASGVDIAKVRETVAACDSMLSEAQWK